MQRLLLNLIAFLSSLSLVLAEDCYNSSAIIALTPGTPYTRKIFPNCTYRYGELAEFINFRHDELSVTCFNGQEKLKTKLGPSQTLFLNVYREPLKELDWSCNFRNAYAESSFFKPFEGLNQKESFQFELRYGGVYDVSPRFTAVWL